jgi:hypothetical protein
MKVEFTTDFGNSKKGSVANLEASHGSALIKKGVAKLYSEKKAKVKKEDKTEE